MQDIWDRLFHKDAEAETGGSEADRYLIVGLGNPGREHKGNRHNIGFMAVDRLAEVCQISLGKVQHKALTGNGRCAHQPVILAKPQTYMNLSGDAVAPIAAYYHIPPEKVLVIYDELDLALGTIRLREKGGTGGHNGMKSIVNHLGQDFPRMRLGIGRPPGKMSPAAYVLQDFAQDDLPLVAEMLDEAVRAVETFIGDGINLAMTRHNTQRKQDE